MFKKMAIRTKLLLKAFSVMPFIILGTWAVFVVIHEYAVLLRHVQAAEQPVNPSALDELTDAAVTSFASREQYEVLDILEEQRSHHNAAVVIEKILGDSKTEQDDTELLFDLGQMYSRRNFSLRAEQMYDRVLGLAGDHSMAAQAKLAEQWRRRQNARLKQEYIRKKGRGDDVDISWWRTDLEYSPLRSEEATDWWIGLGESFFSLADGASASASHQTLGLDRYFENGLRTFMELEFSTYNRRPHQTFQFDTDISYRFRDEFEIALLVGQEDMLQSFATMDSSLSRYYLGSRFIWEPTLHTQLSGYAKQFWYDDHNRATEYNLRAQYMLSAYPRILKLIGRFYNVGVSKESTDYWTPGYYRQESIGLGWYHYLNQWHFEGSERFYYYLEGYLTLDDDNETGTEFKTGIAWDSAEQWKLGLEYAEVRSDVYDQQRGTVFVQYRW